MEIKHSAEKWFADEGGFLKYYTEKYAGNIFKNIEIQRSVIKKWNKDDATEMNTLAERIANIHIRAITRWKEMNIKPWELLGEDTKFHLREAVCDAVKKVTKNNELYERTSAQNINLGQIQIVVDATNWMNAQDAIGAEAKNNVELSGIDDYEWILEDQLVVLRETGIIQTIAKADLNKVPDLAQFMEVN